MTATARSPIADPGLAAKVAFLRRPDSYGARAGPVTAVETHMSWVFLRGRDAYKLKKPSRLPYLDFTTLALREHYCREELRLNRRLSEGVYLGVVPLTGSPDGALGLAGDGATVDWLVHMRRLPDARMLDRMIVAGTLRPDDVAPLAARLARFYRDASPVPYTPAAYRAQLAGTADACAAALRARRHALPRGEVDAAAAAVGRALAACAGILATRAPRVVEAHGDLRPEHVCLADPPQIIDALEFARALRLMDPVDELAFLALECGRLGAPWVGGPLLAAYAATTGDAPPDRLVRLYQAYRALVRAHVAIRHLDDGAVRDRAKWVARARSYLRLACERPPPAA